MSTKNTGRPRRPIPVEKVILYLAAGFAAYNFGLAGGYIEGTRFSIGGLIAGVVVNLSLVIAASRFGALKGKTRLHQATAAFVGMLILSPVLVSPVIFYSLPESFLGTWWLRALWAIGWPLVADLAIVLAGAVSGKGLIALSEQTATTSVESATETKPVRRTAKKSDGVQTKYPRKCAHCTQLIDTPHAVGAHMKKHHPELCKPKKSLAEALFKPVEKQ